MENFRPGVIGRLGLGYEEAERLRPGIIYCSVSGFGQDGPLRDHPAIDQIVQSVSGLMRVSGLEESGPIRIGIPIVDTFSGVMAALAILSAVIQRDRFGGKGQFVDVAMLDTTMVMMASIINPFLINGTGFERTGNRGFSRAPTADTFPTASGEITIGAVQENQVRRLFAALGRAELGDDPRFADRDRRMANDVALRKELQAAFATRSAADWGRILAKAGVPAGEVLEFGDVLARGWIDERDLKLSIPFADQRVEILNAGFRFAHGGPGHGEAAPRLGEHTGAVLGSM